MLYPDACGGGGRGWICQNGSFNGRGHALKETCALHTARLSCEALVDCWSASGDETRRSLSRMKEEDFIERLIFRFNSKRFCRDCRHNVLREFKEMKELKRSRKEPECTQCTQCTRWFWAADIVLRYEGNEEAKERPEVRFTEGFEELTLGSRVPSSVSPRRRNSQRTGRKLLIVNQA